jgi:hypothetical protein
MIGPSFSSALRKAPQPVIDATCRPGIGGQRSATPEGGKCRAKSPALLATPDLPRRIKAESDQAVILSGDYDQNDYGKNGRKRELQAYGFFSQTSSVACQAI